MKWRRILRYGFLYWIIGVFITFTEARFGISRIMVTIIFFVVAALLPLALFWFYFRRGASPSWQSALRIGLVWIILFTLLDGILYIGLAGMTWSTYLSWYVAVDYIILLLIGAGVGQWMRQGRSQTEGLA